MRLVDAQGQVRFGHYKQPVDEVNASDYRLFSPMGKLEANWKRWLAHKRFQYFGGMSEEVIFGCALADLKYVGAVFVYVYQPKLRKMLFESSWKSLVSHALQMSDSPTNGVSQFTSGKNKICMRYQDLGKSLEITLQDKLKIEAFCADGSPYQPMALCSQAGKTGWVYAQKTAGLPLKGKLTMQALDVEFEAVKAFGHHDFSSGFMRHETFWNWACFSGQTSEGENVGLNLSCGVNETSYSENCIWLDSKLLHTGQARFHYNRENLQQPWQIETECGMVRLGFQPEGHHSERLDAIFLATNFRQIFGRFDGVLQLGSRVLHINLLGFVEEQYARW